MRQILEPTSYLYHKLQITYGEGISTSSKPISKANLSVFSNVIVSVRNSSSYGFLFIIPTLRVLLLVFSARSVAAPESNNDCYRVITPKVDDCQPMQHLTRPDP
jgi:hypothetical protein